MTSDLNASDTSTQKIRLTVGDGCDDYVFVEFEQFDNDTLAAANWRLGTHSGGTDTILATSHIDGDPGGSVGVDRPVDLDMCWDGDALIGGPSSNPGLLQANGVTPAGGQVGIATVALVGTVTFDSILLESSASDDYADCDECPSNCCDGPAPDEMTVVISASGTANVATGITYDCGQLAGTHVLTRQSPGGEGMCIWVKTFSTSIVYHPSEISESKTTKIQLATVDINALPTVRCTFPSAGSPFSDNFPLLTFESSTPTDVPCADWDGDQTEFTPTGTHCTSGATCEASA